jgi:hypothetical protein
MDAQAISAKPAESGRGQQKRIAMSAKPADWVLQAEGFEPPRISPTELETVTLTTRSSLLKSYELTTFYF